MGDARYFLKEENKRRRIEREIRKKEMATERILIRVRSHLKQR